MTILDQRHENHAADQVARQGPKKKVTKIGEDAPLVRKEATRDFGRVTLA